MKLEWNSKFNQKIELDEESHSYKFNGVSCISVTTLLQTYKTPFDEEKHSKIISERTGRSQEEVKSEWKEKNINSQEFGTKIHLYAENKLKGQSIIPDNLTPREKKYFEIIDKYFDEHNELIPLASELKLCLPTYKLAGTLDMALKSKDDKIFLYDFKTSKEISTTNYKKMLKNPISHIGDSNFYTYSLQLNIYAYMLYKLYDVKVNGLYIIHLTEDGYKEFKCPFMSLEVEAILFKRFLEVLNEEVKDIERK